MIKLSPNEPCPCHSGLKYKKCCRSYHQGRPIPTPLATMRSRYSGFSLQMADHIIRTTHPDNTAYKDDKERWRAEIQLFSSQTYYTDLKILDHDETSVTFTAKLTQNGHEVWFTEKSEFALLDGSWLYLSGETIDGSDD